MATKSLEQELLGLENRFWQAMKDKDVKAALDLTDDPCVVAGPQGIGNVDKATFKKMMETAQWTLNDWQFTDTQVRKLNDDTAIVAYKVHEEITVDGKPVTIDAADTSMWIRRNGRWLCTLHTESLIGDPYGRDRKSAS